MASSFSVSLSGVAEMQRALNEAAGELRKKIVRGALKKAGKVVQEAVRARAPVLKTPDPRRRPGTLQKAVSVRVSKDARRGGNEGVYINVRPLTKARIQSFKRAQAKRGRKAAGAMNPADPFYWRWVEFDRRYVPPGAGKPRKGGLTVYTQRLRDGRMATRTATWAGSSISGRRRTATKIIPGKRFLRDGAAASLPQAGQAFIDAVVPEIARLNRKVTSRVR